MRALSLSLALATALGTGPAIAQDAYGTVVTELGVPAIQYPMVVTGPDENTVMVLTDQDGGFVVSPMSETGPYTVHPATEPSQVRTVQPGERNLGQFRVHSFGADG